MENIRKCYKNSLVQFYQAKMPPNVGGCTVMIDNGNLLIDYAVISGEKYLWRCSELTPGHYECKYEGKSSGHASLHCFKGSNIYEGYLELEEGDITIEGMWRIKLGTPLQIPDNSALSQLPKEGDVILVFNEEGAKWEKCKVTAVWGDRIETAEFEDLLLSNYGQDWKFSKKK